VRDYFETGARIRIKAPEMIGSPLLLLLCSLGEAFEAEIVWRRGNEIGLSFLRRCNIESPETSQERTARRLRIERLPRSGSWPPLHHDQPQRAAVK